MFDATLQAIAVEVVPEETHVALVIMLGLALPTPDGKVLRVPGGILRLPMSRDAAIKHGTELKDAGESVPEKKESDLVVANSLQGVDEAARANAQFRSGA